MSTAGRTGAPSRPQTDQQADAHRAGQDGTPTGATRPVPTGGAPRPAMTGPRRVKLTVSRADPWSVMKMSFLISVAIGIAGVAMVAVLWLVLNGMGVFSDIERTVSSVLSSGATEGGSQFNLFDPDRHEWRWSRPTAYGAEFRLGRCPSTAGLPGRT